MRRQSHREFDHKQTQTNLNIPFSLLSAAFSMCFNISENPAEIGKCVISLNTPQ